MFAFVHRAAFIAAAGCIPGEDRSLAASALDVARMAVEMQRLCSTLTAPDGSPVVMRIGLHCGPVVGGVVDGSMLRYQCVSGALGGQGLVRRILSLRAPAPK